jgi:hypothetical protein
VLQISGGVAPVAEPSEAEAAPVISGKKYEAHLPLVEREFAVKMDSSTVIVPTARDPNRTASGQAISNGDNYCSAPNVDAVLLTRLRNLLKPTLIDFGELLRR